MTNENGKEFAELIVNMFNIYGKGNEANEKTLKFYYGLFQEYEIEKITIAIMKCIRSLKFLPKPAEIIENLPTQPKDNHTAVYRHWHRYDAQNKNFLAEKLTEEERKELGVVLP